MQMKNKCSSAIVFALIVCLCLLCACAGERGPLVNGTDNAVTVWGEYIYYINGIGSTPGEDYQYQIEQGALCRMNKDGTNREIILPMVIATYQIADDTIYAVMNNYEDKYIIISCDMQGGNCKRIAEMQDGVFQYMQGYLYFQTEEGIVRTCPDGSGRTVLDPRTPVSTSVWGDHIYCTFADEQTGIASLEKISLDGSEEPTVIKDTECYMMGSGKEGVYYLSREDSVLYLLNGSNDKSYKMIFTLYAEYCIDDESGIAYGSLEDGGIYRHNMQTGEKVKLNDHAGGDFILTDKYLYFTNASDNNFLYRIRLEDKHTEIVTATVPLSGRTYIIDGYIYYTSPNEQSKIFRIDEQTLERVCIHYGY